MSTATDRAGGPPLDAAPGPRAVSSEVDLPQHVRTAFGVRDAPAVPVLVAGIPSWRCQDILIRPVTDNAQAAWSARVLDTLQVDGLRVARPLRCSDGRWVVAGYSACEYVSGSPEPRYDELVTASLRLHAATASVRRPRLLDDRDGLTARADAAAWGERVIALEPSAGGLLFDDLARYRRQVRLPAQVVHADLFGTVLFDGDAPPAILDLVPFWRPVEWAAAVIVVDALAWGGGDPGLLRTWSHLDGWPQALLRALLFRVALHAQHPASSAASLRGLESAADLIVPRL
ncbi:MAG TPA: TIGR02569 family protein [Pseudonocardia sp.]|uniref:TIGR02569 family protein n=1 Tax=Pseudonocardia sp. TaxID=60912 RepID=UPI002C58CA08|nr:TIGR02569 family protein [Pseudonocardia sp.]HTF55365.1 TIGR02569 family protein [Pseudonocardia sp.]